METITKAERGLYGLVNNAGIATAGTVAEASAEEFDLVMAVNVYGPYRISRALLPLITAARGRITNIGSISGILANANLSAYAMSKHAIEGLTKAMAVELAPTGIRVNSVCPTFTQTPLVRDLLASSDRLDDVLARIPLGRLGRVEEVAAAVVYLASPAAAMVTGASLLIDGGWTAQ